MKSKQPNAGQALLELVVGLVALLVLTAGLLQLGRLGWERLENLYEARAQAGEFALAGHYTTALPAPRDLQNWAPGPDGRRYSRDDRPIMASAAPFRARVLAHARPAALEIIRPGNPVSALDGGGPFATTLGLVHGRAQRTVPLYPLVAQLLYRAENIALDDDAWMTWTQGLGHTP